jgi:hypothetical protein
VPTVKGLMTEEQVGNVQKRSRHKLGGDSAEGEEPGPPAGEAHWEVEGGATSYILQWLR